MSNAEKTVSVTSSRTDVGARTRAREPDTSPLPSQELVASDDWEHSPNNPRNWSPLQKWTPTVLVSYAFRSTVSSNWFPQVSLYTLVPPLASSMMAPGLPDLALKYGITNPTILALTLSIFLLSFAIGPLFMGPLSEMYGRVWVPPYVVLCFLS